MLMPTVDDFRQMLVIAKNEIRKFISSRKFSIYLVLVILSLCLVTILPFIFGDGLGDDAGTIFMMYVAFASLMVLLAATLFASNTIVSEFEERTALILFTRPVKKSSIFMGKLIACLLVEGVVIAAYYILGVLVAFAFSGELVSSFLPSLAMALAYMFAASGVAMLVSSFSKKGGTSAVITFITILLIVPIVSTMLSSSGIDPWFMLDEASGAILESIPEYVDTLNEAFTWMADQFGSGVDLSSFMTEMADTVQSGLVMLGWGIATYLISWILFARREF